MGRRAFFGQIDNVRIDPAPAVTPKPTGYACGNTHPNRQRLRSGVWVCFKPTGWSLWAWYYLVGLKGYCVWSLARQMKAPCSAWSRM